MGKQFGFYLNLDRCVQCHACEVACKSHNRIELGVSWMKLVSLWAGQYPNLTNRTISVTCMHCGDPTCATECPEKAITKRPEDGIVLVDRSKCVVGCRDCAEACPYGVLQWGADGKVQKCDLCVDRLDQGGRPVCVETCPGEALHFGTMEELSKLAPAGKAHKLAGKAQPSMLVASSEWSTLSSVLPWE